MAQISLPCPQFNLKSIAREVVRAVDASRAPYALQTFLAVPFAFAMLSPPAFAVTYYGEHVDATTNNWVTDVSKATAEDFTQEWKGASSGALTIESLYAGISSGKTSRNTVTVSAGTITTRLVGGASDVADCTENTVILNAGDFGASEVVGGESAAQAGSTVSKNTVSIAGGTYAGAMVYGGKATQDAAVVSNTVVLDAMAEDADFKYVDAGYAIGNGTVEKNKVTVLGGRITKSLNGGYAEGTGEVKENTVTLGEEGTHEIVIGTGSGSAYINGGYSESGSATGNTVTLNRGVLKETFVYGGYVKNTEVGSASHNCVDVKSGVTLQGAVTLAGGYCQGVGENLEVSENRLTVSDATAQDCKVKLYGARSIGNVLATRNSVIASIDGSVVDVYGAFAAGLGDVTENTVLWTGGTITGTLQGGHTSLASALTGNSVTVTGGTVSGTIYGGYSQIQSAGGTSAGSGNAVTLSGGTFTGATIAGGYVAINKKTGGSANFNSVTLLGSETSVARIEATTKGIEILGGMSRGTGDSASVEGNDITVDGAAFTQGTGKKTIDLYGGVSLSTGTAHVKGNSVSILRVAEGSTVRNIYGGYSTLAADAVENIVTLNAGTVTGDLKGGVCNTLGDAYGNKVFMTGGTVKGAVMGGYTKKSNAGLTSSGGNSVTLTGGCVSGRQIFGGFASSPQAIADVQCNAVTIAGTTTIDASTTPTLIAGGASTTQMLYSVSQNSVTIEGGTFEQTTKNAIDVYGGYSTGQARVENNTVTIRSIEAGSIDTVMGGYAAGNNASGNTVRVEGGTITGTLFGGKSELQSAVYADQSAAADANAVFIEGGTLADVIGAQANDSVKNNTVVLDGGTLQAAIVGFTSSGVSTANVFLWESGTVSQSLTGGKTEANTLVLVGAGKSVPEIMAFQNYLFALDETVKSAPMLTLTDEKSTLTLAEGNLVGVTFAKDAKVALDLGEKVTLIRTQARLTDERAEKTNAVSGVLAGLAENTVATSEIAKRTTIAENRVNRYTFGIGQEGEDLVAAVTEVDPSEVTKALRQISDSNVVAFRAQMNDVNRRMGELRGNPEGFGAWARVYGGKYSMGAGTKEKSLTLQMGGDRWFSNNFYAGLMGAYTKADDTFSNGGNDQENWNLGLYAGYVAESGAFWDATFKAGRFGNDFKLVHDDGALSKAAYHTWGQSFSFESGWRLTCPQTNFFVEPQAELMYGHLNSATFTDNLGVTTSQSNVDSFVLRAGLVAGYNFEQNRGSAYVKASVLHDSEGKVESSSRFGSDVDKDGGKSRDLGGTWGEFAMGATFKARENLNLYGELLCTTKVAGVRTKWQGSLGMRYMF